MTQSKAENIFQEFFLKFVKAKGFDVPDKRLANAYKKTTFGYLYIGNNITDKAHKLHVLCGVSARLDQVENIITPFANEIEGKNLDYYAGNFVTLITSSIPYVKLYSRDWELDFNSLIIQRTEGSVNEYCHLFEKLIDTHMMPLVESLLDYKVLENKIRKTTSNYEDLNWKEPKSGERFTEFLSLQYHLFRMLIIAWLAGVDDFEEVYVKLNASKQELINYGGKIAKYPIALDKIYHQLKTTPINR